MGIIANGKYNYIRKKNDAYCADFCTPYLNSIKLDISQSKQIKKYLLDKTIKGALIGITYLDKNFYIDNIKERGYYSLYFYTNEKERFGHGIVLELSNQNKVENHNHIFEYKVNNGYLIFYGLDYDQYLFQRGSIALLEVQSDVLKENNYTFANILEKIKINKDLIDLDEIKLSKILVRSIWKIFNFSLENIFNIINEEKVPKGKNILSEEIL